MDNYNPFGRLCEAWRLKLVAAQQYKKQTFSDDAAKGMMYFRSSAKEIWADSNVYAGENQLVQSTPSTTDDDINPPAFKVTLAKVAELVELFGPILYPTNPTRTMTPRQFKPVDINMLGNPEDPQIQQLHQSLAKMAQQNSAKAANVSGILEDYLNYTPNELGLERETRLVIDEALIKGMGMFEHKLVESGGSTLVGSFYRNIDELLIDPDARTPFNVQPFNAKWIGLMGCKPYWELEEIYELPKGSLKQYTTKESSNQTADVDSQSPWPKDFRERYNSKDLLPYCEIYSRIGVGGKLDNMDEETAKQLQFGRYSYFVVAPNVPYPLNMPNDKFDQLMEVGDIDSVLDAFEWDFPFWIDGQWPVTPLVFHQQPNCPWPISHIKPALPLLKFLNWAMGYLMGKVRVASQTPIAIWKEMSEDFKEQFMNGTDMPILELTRDGPLDDINKVATVFQMPPFQGDIYKMIEWAMAEFEKSIGLSEVLYGMQSRQSRSATESQLRSQHATSRVDDMHSRVRDTATLCSRKEAFICRLELGASDVAPVVGPQQAKFVWERFVMETDPIKIMREYEYQLEEDSGIKPNRSAKLQAFNELLQYGGQLYQQMAMQGQPQGWNGLITLYGKLMNQDVSYLLIPPPPPQEGPSPEEMEMMMEQQKHQMDMALKQMDAQIKQQDAQMKMQGDAMKLQNERQKFMLEIAKSQASIQSDAQGQRQKMLFDMLSNTQELAQKRQTNDLDYEFQEDQNEQALQFMDDKFDLELAGIRAKNRAQAAAAKQNGNGSSSKDKK